MSCCLLLNRTSRETGIGIVNPILMPPLGANFDGMKTNVPHLARDFVLGITINTIGHYVGAERSKVRLVATTAVITMNVITESVQAGQPKGFFGLYDFGFGLVGWYLSDQLSKLLFGE